MNRILKYLLSFLLLFGLTVTECGLFSNMASAKLDPISIHISKKEDRHEDTKMYVYGLRRSFKEQLDLPRISYSHLKRAANLKVRSFQKAGQLVYQRIKATNAASAFLIQRISSQDINISLYMA